jgi:hypothetical protein
MKTYFPFLRGKQNELMAVRELADRIAQRGTVVPIIEPVNGNATTGISIDRYIEVSMPFVFICNPLHGEFAGHPQRLFTQVISEELMEYDNWTPAFQVRRDSTRTELSAFLDRYSVYEVGIVYQGLPTTASVRALLGSEAIGRHIFVKHYVPTEYINEIPESRRVMVTDPFNRQQRNADYPDRELFTDMNTLAGNPRRLDFGDFSIVGDHYTETGGPAYAVTIHHIHFQTDAGPLDISHFISDRTDTTVDTPGKTLEALEKLVEALGELNPNNTEACNEYREMASTGSTRGLGYLKRLAIKHHLEIMLGAGIQL